MPQPIEYPRLAEDAFNRRDIDALARLWAEDFHYVAPGEETRTREQARTRERALWEAFPDLRADLSRHFADDGRLLIEGVLRGTHSGILRLGAAEIAPSGRPVAIRFAAVFEFAGEVARGERVYFDRLDLLVQLGLLPPGVGR